jgi:hypothetical protein
MTDEKAEGLLLGALGGILWQTARFCHSIDDVLLLHHPVCCIDELSKPAG